MNRLAFFKDSKGHGWHVLIQQMHDSCGPTAVTMVESLCFHKPFSEERTREISGLYPGGWSANGMAGTQARNLVHILQGSAGLNATLYRTQGEGAARLLRHVHKSRPAIVRIGWKRGGGHFIVCPRMYHDGTTIFLDPIFGLVEMPVKSLPTYNAHNGQLSKYALGEESGTITHVIVIA